MKNLKKGLEYKCGNINELSMSHTQDKGQMESEMPNKRRIL